MTAKTLCSRKCKVTAFGYLEPSAISRHFSTISTDFPKTRLKPFLSAVSSVLIYCSIQLRLCSRPIAAFRL